MAKVKRKPKQKPKPKRKGPVWQGPEVDGVTQSMLSRFLVCRERFRLLVVEGLKPVDAFNHRIEYGQMWHLCEEAMTMTNDWDWHGPLKRYCQKLCKRYPLHQEQIQHWYNVCKVQFPIYISYWARHSSGKSRVPLLREQTFDVPYELSSGRIVRLRGKWDEVELVGKGKRAGVYLGEHKTKGDINEQQMKRQLQFDLQTMVYLVALNEFDLAGILEPRKMRVQLPNPIKGINYNVVRRPLSGGKGTIRRHKATSKKPEETAEHFYARVADVIKEDPGHYFMKWQVEITPDDLERFKREFLNPILEQLCDWWKWISWAHSRSKSPFDDPGEATQLGLNGLLSYHWRHPFGVYNVLNEGGASDLDEYLATGSELGLQRVENLFPELE